MNIRGYLAFIFLASTLIPYAAAVRECKDGYGEKFCQVKQSRNLCQHRSWEGFLKKNCAKTCGWCTDGGGTKVLTNSTTPETTAATVTHAPVTPIETVAPITRNPDITYPPSKGTCGVSRVQQSRVISGEVAKPDAWPWHIIMNYMRFMYLCGGALVAPSWIVTAAHCVKGKQTYQLQIELGTSDKRKRPDQKRSISKIIIHPDYANHSSDIALIKLSRPAVMNSHVGTVCLPNPDKDPAVGTKCYVSGFGKTGHPGKPSNVMMQTDLSVIDKQTCHKLNYKSHGVPVTDKMICAGSCQLGFQSM